MALTRKLVMHSTSAAWACLDSDGRVWVPSVATTRVESIRVGRMAAPAAIPLDRAWSYLRDRRGWRCVRVSIQRADGAA